MPGELLWTVAVHLVLTGVPGIAAVLFALRQGLRDVPVLLGVGLATSGVTALLAFWAFLPGPFLGHSAAYGIFFGSVAVIAWCAPALRGESALLRRLAIPLALWALGTLFVVGLGFVHEGTSDPVNMATTRFSGQLPSDNAIPEHFADWFFDEGYGGGPPPFIDWQSSDRGPLQVGYVLAQRIFLWDESGLHYQVLGVAIQQLWIVGLWALLCAARLGVRTRALAMVAALVSDVAILHGFFVWPKLIAAAFILAIAALLFSPRTARRRDPNVQYADEMVPSASWERVRTDPRAAALVACLAALALLAHGASVFGLIPLAALAAYRGFPGWRWVGVGVAVGLVLIAPWTAYQRIGDPPGNRLLKWHLAGAAAIDDRSLPQAFVDEYGEAGVGGALENKKENFLAVLGGDYAIDKETAAAEAAFDGDWQGAIEPTREVRFLNFLPLLGLFLFAPVLMAVARKRGRESPAEWRFALGALAVVAFGLVAWCLLLFGTPDSRAIVHLGSLALPLLAIAGAVAGLRATFPRFAIALVALNSLLALVLYVPAFSPIEGTSYSVPIAILAALGLAGFCWTALRHDDASAPAPGPNTLAR